MSERYEILEKIGRGGIGAIYRARDTVMNREVAIKRLLPLEETHLNESAERRKKRLPLIVFGAAMGILVLTLIIALPLLGKKGDDNGRGDQTRRESRFDTNLLEGKPVKASSEETRKSHELKAGKAVDGLLISRWSAAEASKPQWLEIDLGEPTHIRHIRILWEIGSGKVYRHTVEGSKDGESWTMIEDASNISEPNGETVHIVDAPDTRFLRVTAVGPRWPWTSILEIEAYDKENPRI